MPAPEGRRIVYQGGPRPLQGDTLDDAQLGTGQGASTFGRGHYVAENPVVGESYARQLGEDGRGFTHELDIPEGPYIDIFKPFSQQDPRAQEAIRRLAPQFNWDAITSEMSDALTILGRNEQRVAEQLSAEGVRGLRYLDQRSRPGSGISHLGDPTSNYVVFRGADARRRFPDFGHRAPPPTTPTGTAPFGDPRAYPQSVWEEFGSLQGGTPEARLRAQEQGFDTERVLYHGTRNNFENFQPSEAGALGPGVYVTPGASTANHYAGSGVGGSARGGRILPVYARGRLASYDDFERAMGNGALDESDAVRRLSDEGFSGVERVHDSGIRHINVFDPRNIRSIFAAFDPAKRDSSDLLAASAAATPIPIAAHAQQQNTTGRPRGRPGFFGAQR